MTVLVELDDDLVRQLPDDRPIDESVERAVRLLVDIEGADEILDGEWDKESDTFRWSDERDEPAEVEP